MNRELLTTIDARRKKHTATGLAHCLPAITYARDVVPPHARIDLHDAIRAELARLEDEDAEQGEELSHVGRKAGVILG